MLNFRRRFREGSMKEAWMSWLQSRGSIAWAAALLVLFLSRRVDAQVVAPCAVHHHHGSPPSGLAAGAWLERLDRPHAQRRVQNLQAKLRSDVSRGDTADAACDARRLDRARFRLAVDEWLIRDMAMQDPGHYPLRIDPVSASYIAQMSQPAYAPALSPLVPLSAPVRATPAPPPPILNAGPWERWTQKWRR